MPEESKDMPIVEVVRDLKRRDPFQAFTILLTSGDRYVIERGENLVEMRSEFFYAFPGGERFVFLRMNQIAAVDNHAPAGRGKRRRSA